MLLFFGGLAGDFLFVFLFLGGSELLDGDFLAFKL